MNWIKPVVKNALCTRGKIGISYGGMPTPGVFLQDSVTNNSEADWVALELVSIDDKPAMPIVRMPVTRYYAINKNCEHTEALMKMVEAGSEGYSREQKEDKWGLVKKF